MLIVRKPTVLIYTFILILQRGLPIDKRLLFWEVNVTDPVVSEVP